MRWTCKFGLLAGLLASALAAGALAGAAEAAPPWARDGSQGWNKPGPPPWAPAHGYRAKRGLPPAGHSDALPAVEEAQVYSPEDLDIHLGSCNRELMGSVLGGEIGGEIGTQIGGGDAAAGVAGQVIGILIGGSIGRAMDPLDQLCIAQALEAAGDHDRVTWENPDTGTWYRLTPQRIYTTAQGRYCRSYRLEAEGPTGQRQTVGRACRDDSGRWFPA